MTIEIKVPTVGESINEVILAGWLVNERSNFGRLVSK